MSFSKAFKISSKNFIEIGFHLSIDHYKRRTPSLEAPIPELYMRSISTNNFPEALATLLGENGAGLSATNVSHIKEVNRSWQTSRFDGILRQHLQPLEF